PRPPASSTLFPYTTLFRSSIEEAAFQTIRPLDHPDLRHDLGATLLHARVGDLHVQMLFSILHADHRHGVLILVDHLRDHLEIHRDRKSTRLNSSHVSISYA